MMPGAPATTFQESTTSGVVDLLAARPELRELFPLAAQVDEWVRA